MKSSTRLLHQPRAAKCLTENMASICLIYGKFLKIVIVLEILIFYYKMAIVWQFDFIVFWNSYFFDTFTFLSLTIKKRSVLM